MNKCTRFFLKVRGRFLRIKNYFLCKKYPFLYVDSDVYPWMHGLEETWLDCMPIGQKRAFGRKLCNEIKDYLSNHELSCDYHIYQVKEKFGRLEWYDNGDEGLYDIIDEYSALFETLCCVCGKSATVLSRGWICPYCDHCYIKNYPNDKEMNYCDRI